MISEKFQNIIIKYLNKQASFMELEALEKWLEENATHQKYFINYVKNKDKMSRINVNM